MLLAEEVETTIAGNGEQPSGKAILGREGIELAEGLSESLYGQVVGFGGIMGHAEQHQIDGLAVETHQIGISFLVAFFTGGKD